MSDFLTAMITVATLARLMPPELPQFIDLSQVADANETLRGTVQVDEMSRLQASVSRADSPAELVLTFFRDDSAAIHMRGSVAVSIEMQCQRCLLPMNLDLNNEIGVVVVSDEAELQELQVDAEPLVNASNKLDLVQFIEDEVLLALPIAPLHAVAECGAIEIVEQASNKSENPFAVLKDLLKTEKP